VILKDPDGEPLDRILERNQGQPLDLTRFLLVAIGLKKASADSDGIVTSPIIGMASVSLMGCRRTRYAAT
jgi:hypothetical protein